LAELLAAAEKRKYGAIRQKLQIQESLKIEGIQLESLAYHLGERSGTVFVKLEGETLRVGESGGSSLPYHGDAVGFLLKAWQITREQALKGFTLEVKNGVRQST